MRVREARPEDHEAMVRLWAALETGQAPPEPARWQQLYMQHTLFVEGDGGELVGYGLFYAFADRGDIRQVSVVPSARRRGVGRTVMAAIAERLRAHGCREWRLEVREENAPAIALYRSIGMEVLHDIDILRFDRATVEAFALTRSGALDVTEVDPKDDAKLEEWFDLGRGQLARYRESRPGVMWRIADRALTLYSPDLLPGCGLMFPFRAMDREHAAHLVAAAIAEGMPAELELLVVGTVAARAMERAGARRTERLQEMRGSL